MPGEILIRLRDGPERFRSESTSSVDLRDDSRRSEAYIVLGIDVSTTMFAGFARLCAENSSGNVEPVNRLGNPETTALN
jgi:hypothetical protein